MAVPLFGYRLACLQYRGNTSHPDRPLNTDKTRTDIDSKRAAGWQWIACDPWAK